MSGDLTNLSQHPPEYFESARQDMLRFVPQHVRTTLEFGCGFGGFSSLLKTRRNCETWAVEKDPQAAHQATQRLDRVICADAPESLSKLPQHYFDCIVFLDVLEHLADPYTLLLSVCSKLTERGVILVSLPNVRYYRTLVDYVVHGDWDYVDHGVLDKTHLRFFTKKSIVRMFTDLGFELLQLQGLHPTSSRTFRVVNALLLGRLADCRHKHFAAVVKPSHLR